LKQTFVLNVLTVNSPVIKAVITVNMMNITLIVFNISLFAFNI